MKLLSRALLAVTLSVCTFQAQALPSYNLIEFQTLGGGFINEGRGINANNQVAGTSSTPMDAELHAVRWAPDGTVTDLGVVNGIASFGSDINDSGQIAGASEVLGPFAGGLHAIRWAPDGTPTDLGTVLGGFSSGAFGINASGQVVGDSQTTTLNESVAVRWEADGTPIILDSLGGIDSQAFAINDSGQATGGSTLMGLDDGRAVRWEADGTATNLGTLGGSFSFGLDINNNGQVAGGSATAGDVTNHAVRWEADNSLTDLGTLGLDSFGEGIDSAGQVVGSSQLMDSSFAAFFFDDMYGMLDLNTLVADLGGFLSLEFAADINDNGFITGGGTYFNSATGQQEVRAFLLSPIADNGNGGGSGTPVSEPSTLAMLGLGLLGLMRLRRFGSSS